MRARELDLRWPIWLHNTEQHPVMWNDPIRNVAAARGARAGSHAVHEFRDLRGAHAAPTTYLLLMCFAERARDGPFLNTAKSHQPSLLP